MFARIKQVLLVLIIAFCYSITIYSESRKVDTNYQSIDNYSKTTREPFKKLTFLCYIAADNDLAPFADRNLEQMATVGTNENINIIVHLDIRKKGDSSLRGKTKITKRLIVRKGRLEQVGNTMCMDSGLAETVIDAATWAINDFPSRDLVIDFWNHGSGCLNPSAGRIINPTELFSYDHKTNLIVLDRSIGFIDYVNQTVGNCETNRGICFDETTGHYLDDVKLTYALQEITQRRGKKIDLIIFDACLMAATEVACLVAPYCNYMTASEEVELGTGYDYNKVLSIAANNYTNAHDFAFHIVNAFKATYNNVTNDYTQSAVDLSKYNNLNSTVNNLAEAFLTALQFDYKRQLINLIKKSKNRLNCTHFDEPSYIDLRHFCANIIENINNETPSLQKNTQLYPYIHAIVVQAESCIECLSDMVVNNAVGLNLSKAGGLSIYFPIDALHESYPKTVFGKQNSWCDFIDTFTSL
jgi:hypothetical protein